MLLSLTVVVFAAVPSEEPISLAAAEWVVSGVSSEQGTVLLEFFTQKLTAEGQIRVTTERDISTLLGLERQRQLMGCSETAAECLVELAGALGVEGLVTGTVGRIGQSFTASVRVRHARDGRLLVEDSTRVDREEALMDFLAQAARRVSAELKKALRPMPPLRVPPSVWIPAAGGAALCAGGGLSLLLAEARARQLRVDPLDGPEHAQRLGEQGKQLQTLGQVLLVAGGAALATAGVVGWLTPQEGWYVTVTPGEQAAAVGIGGTLP